MSAAQRQSRRKTARQFFDEDEEPPAKRSKVESVPITNGVSKSAAGKSATTRTKRAKTSYDEDEDGFTFARKTRSKKATEEPVPVSKPQASPAKSRAVPRTTTRSDSKTDSRITSTSSDTDPARPKRRSARLSGDKEEVVQILPAEKTKRKRKSNELQTSEANRDGSPDLPQNDLQVEKKRDGTKIALPFADTPVINRNKEMRAMKSKVPNRRSSVNSRGRRASSLIESGTSNGRPPRVLRTYGRNTPKTTKKLARFSSFLSDSSLHSQPLFDTQSHPQSQAQTALESEDLEATAPIASDRSRLSVTLLPNIFTQPQLQDALESHGLVATAAAISDRPQISVTYLPDVFTQTQDDDELSTDEVYDTAIPHSDVAVADFYKHISNSLVEPRRMRQLLTWSATRALPPKQHDHLRDGNEAFTMDAARSIVEDLLKDFSSKDHFADWFDKLEGVGPGDAGTAIIKKPNPRNSANALRLQKLEEEIAKLKAEEKQWNELVKTSKAEESDNVDMEDIDLSALDPAQAAIFAELRPDFDPEISKAKKRRKSKAKEEAHTSGLEDIASRMRAINSSLEPQIDLFADGIHKMGQYRLAAERVADAILSTTAKKLEIREKSAQEATGTTAMGPKEVLSALAGAMNKNQDR